MTASRETITVPHAEDRIARGEQQITEAADALASAKFPQIALDASKWREVITDALTGASQRTPTDDIAGRNVLGWACARLVEPHRKYVCLTLGAFAKLSQLRWMLAASDDDDISDPLRLVQGALHAYSRVHNARAAGPTVVPVDLPPLALWVLGIIDSHQSGIDLVASRSFGRTQMKQLARRSGWSAMLATSRIADLRWLAKPSPQLRRTVDAVLEASGDKPQSILEIAALSIPSSRREISPAACLLAQVAHGDPDAVWADAAGIGSDGPVVMQRLATIASDRGDVLFLDNRFVIVEPQGFMDALLAYVAAETSDERNSRWHEVAVLSSVKLAWPGAEHLYANVSWRDSPDDGQQHPVAGEFDALVWDRGIFVDFQAKSARSASPDRRERLPVSAALRQHERLHQRRGTRIELLRRGRETPQRNVLTIDLSAHTLIPITVGTDVVQRFQVGASEASGGIPRVLTTLDHLRIVNEVVPSPLRAVYWLDRFAQEFATLRFIDEIDFLAAWSSSVTMGADAGVLQFLRPDGGPKDTDSAGLVLARASEIEEFIAITNTAALGGKLIPEISRLLVAARAPIARMSREAAPILAVLADQGLRASDLYWPFARMLAGNWPTEVQSALAAPQPTVLHKGLVPVGFSPGPVLPEHRAHYQRQGVHIVVEQRGRSRSLVAISEDARSVFQLPRFDPGRASS